MTTANLLLHPVRRRILRAMLGPDPLTTGQLLERLPDIPPATMYRHVAVLANAGVLEVAEERRVRGSVERSYRVRQDRAVVDLAARQEMTLDDHRQAFTAFSATLMSDFDRYLGGDDADPADEGLLYRQGVVWLTGDEFAALVEEIEALVAARAGHTEGDGRARHVFSVVVMPDKPEPTPASTPASTAASTAEQTSDQTSGPASPSPRH
ncbi:ArsR family transcriptional regulator [Nonomuraea sp. MG754425]|nr:ArsR family transcriptional regulator [Nonomuraea sp. MG754425]